MKCLVCKKEFTGDSCPRCGFPVIESTNTDDLLEQLKDQIQDYRQQFEREIKLELIIYRWKESNGTVVQDRKDRIPFGSYPELCGKETWLSQEFARIPDADKLRLQYCVSARSEEKEHTLQIQNLQEPALQRVGIEVDNNYRMRLKLKNDLGGNAASQWTEFL